LHGKALPMASGAELIHRRESGKLDKRRRIGEAARAAFCEFGYKGASMREIAKRAGVATGTLFLYAPDKRSLLLWVINDDLERVSEATFGAEAMAARAQNELLDQLLDIFEVRYRYWGTDPELSLLALQELTTAHDGNVLEPAHFGQHDDRRWIMRQCIAELVAAQQQRGCVRAGEDPDTIARLMIAIYNTAIRSWLRSDDIDVGEGIAELRKLLRLAIEGCEGPIARSAGGTSN
jgi:AcrR family transcriptional regulator